VYDIVQIRFTDIAILQCSSLVRLLAGISLLYKLACSLDGLVPVMKYVDVLSPTMGVERVMRSQMNNAQLGRTQ
jgi:hypothetical protein